MMFKLDTLAPDHPARGLVSDWEAVAASFDPSQALGWQESKEKAAAFFAAERAAVSLVAFVVEGGLIFLVRFTKGGSGAAEIHAVGERAA